MRIHILPLFAVLTAGLLLIAAPASAVYADDALEGKVEAKPAKGLFGLDLGIDLPWTRVGTDSVIYEAPRYGADARLFVQDKAGDTPRWRVYRGPTYDRIVKQNPELGTHAGITLFGTKLGARVGVKKSEPVVSSHRRGMQYYVTAPGMTYERASFDNRARLYVMENGHEYVYVGNDLDSIAKRYPHITKMEGYSTLRKRAHDHPVAWRSNPRSHGRSHVQVWRNGDSYTVRTWSHADGRWTSQSYQGKSLAAIARDNPKAAKHLYVWSDADWSSPDESVSATVAGATIVSAMRDGKLAVIVQEVEDASFASSMMLRAGDEILSIGGKRITSLDGAKLNLASAARSSSAEIKVSRNGKILTIASSPKTAKRTP